MISRPNPSEYAPYAAKYVALVPEGDFLASLEAETEKLRATCAGIPAERSLYRYAPGKWTIRDTVLHIADVERIQSCRAMRFARGETQPLPGFDPSAYVKSASANDCGWQNVVEELFAVRAATLALFRNLPEQAFACLGNADGFPLSVRGVAYIIAGHALHHHNLLREKYLAA